MLNLAIVGLGYWGGHLLRNFLNTPGIRVTALCDIRHEALARASEKAPDARCFQDFESMVREAAADAIAVITPAKTHFPFAQQALTAGRHVFLEKPATQSVADMRELVRLARAGNLALHIDHTPIFPPTVGRLKAEIDRRRMDTGVGLRTYSSVRMGPYALRDDANIVEDMAIHDLAVLDHLLDGCAPDTVSVLGRRWLPDWPVAEAMVNLAYGEAMATIHVSWMSAEKRQLIRVNFADCLSMYEEFLPENKVRIYRMVEPAPGDMPDQYRYMLDRQDLPEPPPAGETLGLVCSHFRDCVAGTAAPLSGADMGLRMACILEAANKSLDLGGQRVDVARP